MNRKTRIVQYFNQEFSSDDGNLIDRYEQEKKKQEELRKQFIALNRQAINRVIDEQLNQSEFQFFRFETLSSQDMNYVIKQVSEKMNVIILVYSESENKVMLSHDGTHGIHCGELFKTIKAYNGRGGGNAKTAQGVFAAADQALSFIEFLKGSVEESL